MNVLAERPDSIAGEGLNFASPGDYFALLKPRVMSLVLFTAIVGLVLAPGHIHPATALTALLCIAVGAGRRARSTWPMMPTSTR